MTGGDTRRSATANHNHATMFFTVSPQPEVDDTAAARAYERARAHLASLPAAPATAEGYRIFWARGEEVGHRDIGPDDYAIVGRHSACDIALPSAAELSLRHLLVATTAVADSPRGLRVLDLRASLPFFTDDGQPRRSIVATGPVVLRLGTYVFGGVPIGPAIERALLPDEMPRAVVSCTLGTAGQTGTASELSTMGADEDDYDPPEPLPPKTLPTPGTLAGSDKSHASRVTVVAGTAFLTEVARPTAPTTFARLTLLRDGHSASLDLPSTDLEAGVLIGRSERCTDGGLRRVLDGNISRIHVLLLREGDDVLVFDLCSTQGTFEHGHSVRRARISRGGGSISLARTNPVMLLLHPRDETSPEGALEGPPHHP
ncbi:MAG: FHA domain-containing protein [Polyangiaceae bacterium]